MSSGSVMLGITEGLACCTQSVWLVISGMMWFPGSRIDTLAIDRKPPGMAHTGAYNTGIMFSEKDIHSRDNAGTYALSRAQNG